MGRRGHAVVEPPKYGDYCITDWAQSQFCNYLAKRGLEVTSGDDFTNTEDADHWDIQIPYRPETKKRKGYTDYAKIRRIIADLRAHPEKIVTDDGDPCGDRAANVLEEGLDAAISQVSCSIAIDWF